MQNLDARTFHPLPDLKYAIVWDGKILAVFVSERDAKEYCTHFLNLPITAVSLIDLVKDSNPCSSSPKEPKSS